ncbi:MAG: hypothetical protein EOP09_11715 [Proteobacteria bacterium]|nr:MAG: hypothetical protein EOP09_11715 [Pseudomonadota bacterium]
MYRSWATAWITLFVCIPAHACQWLPWSFDSKTLSQDGSAPWNVEVMTLAPEGYDANKRYPVVYFLHGRNGNRNVLSDIHSCEALDHHVASGGEPFLMVAASGGNHYWMNGAHNGIRMSDFVAGELIQETDHRFPTRADADSRLIAGMSMGGHGAIQVSLTHPGVFGAIAAHSPVFRTEAESRKNFEDVFGTGCDYLMRDPVSMLKSDIALLKTPLYLDIGGNDVFGPNTILFAEYLKQKGVIGRFILAEDLMGGHDGGYWAFHLPEYMKWYSDFFAKRI